MTDVVQIDCCFGELWRRETFERRARPLVVALAIINRLLRDSGAV